MTAAAVAILLGLAAFGLYLRQGIEVRVHNAGSQTLHSVVVHVTGNAYSLGDLPADATASVQVAPKGESHVEIEFTDERRQTKRPIVDCYFETDYRGTLSVEMDSEKMIRVNNRVKTGF